MRGRTRFLWLCPELRRGLDRCFLAQEKASGRGMRSGARGVRRVFVETSGFYALIVGKDENHGRAQELFTLAHREAWRLVTTNAVVIETHALLLHRSRPGRETAPNRH